MWQKESLARSVKEYPMATPLSASQTSSWARGASPSTKARTRKAILAISGLNAPRNLLSSAPGGRRVAVIADSPLMASKISRSSQAQPPENAHELENDERQHDRDQHGLREDAPRLHERRSAAQARLRHVQVVLLPAAPARQFDTQSNSMAGAA